MRRIAIGLAVASALLLSGCFGGSQRLSEGEARDATEQAIEEFAAAFASPTGGDLRLVRGEFSGGSQDSGIESDVHFEIEWGRDQRTRIGLQAGGAGVSYDIGLHCSPEAVIVTFGDSRFERRPTEGSCLESMQGGNDPLDVGELDDHQIIDVQPHGDGSVTAVLQGDEANVTVEVDARGRLERMDFSGEGGTGFLAAEYGARRPIEMPDATDRMPLLIFGFGHFADGRYEWNVASGDETAPFGEVEVRVMDGANVAATLPARPGSHTDGGFTMTFSDNGDGVFGADDRFTIQSPAWTTPEQYEVVVWDIWAGAEVGDLPMPGLPVLVLLGLVAVLAYTRR